VKILGLEHDLRRIVRFGSGLADLSDYLIDISDFEWMGEFCDWAGNPNEIYRRVSDKLLTFVTPMSNSRFREEFEIEREIERQLNLRHPCIAAPIGFIISVDRPWSRELKIVGLHLEGNSLTEVLASVPCWWTPTVKAKAVVGIVLGLRFCHSLGLVHRALTSNNVIFDSDHGIQIINIVGIGLSECADWRIPDIYEEAAKGWRPKVDIRAFASLLFQIVVGSSVTVDSFPDIDTAFPEDVPGFVSEMIRDELSFDDEPKRSFDDIIDILKANEFGIVAGVDSTEISAFVRFVESFEQSWQSTKLNEL
jgi:serine/threonine protein kinase